MKNLHTLDDYRLKDFEMKFFGTTGDEGNGVFKVFVQGRSFFTIATSEAGWEHVSVSRANRRPTWEEMCAVKDKCEQKEDDMDKQDKPRLAEVLGVDIGERFAFRDGDKELPGLYVDSDGYIWGNGYCVSNFVLCSLINHPESIIRAPRLTEPEIAIMRAVGAKWVSRDERINGFCDLWENKPSVCEGLYANRDKETVPLASVKSRLFPTVKPGDCVEVAE